MACSSPLEAYQAHAGAPLFFGNPNEAERHNYRSIVVACGRCTWCCLERARHWALRCIHEASLFKFNVFVTLTYDSVQLPEDGSLRYRDFQLFMKKLRKTGRKPRFYMCGEYGEIKGRPHYHAILFNCWFSDMRAWRKSSAGFQLYRSDELERLWSFGHAEIGMVSFQSAGYCARYVMKKRLTCAADEKRLEIVNPDTGEIYERVAEFNRMSLKPGIGRGWYDRFKDDVYPRGMVVAEGREQFPPRYYDKLFKAADPDAFEALSSRREVFGAERQRRDGRGYARLKVEDTVLRAKIRPLVRDI